MILGLVNTCSDLNLFEAEALMRTKLILLVATLIYGCVSTSEVDCSSEGNVNTNSCVEQDQEDCADCTSDDAMLNDRGGHQMIDDTIGGQDEMDMATSGTQVNDGSDGDMAGSPFNCNYSRVGQVYVAERYASDIEASGDWEGADAASGAPDDVAAQSPNLDAGEVLSASGWEFCHETGDEEIIKVELAVYGRTQYDSGPFDILVNLSAGGSDSTNWHHTDWRWSSVDITSQQANWTWDDIESLAGEVRLHSHPGGNRDSDVWIDAFRLTVTLGECDGNCISDPPDLDYRCEPVGRNDYGDGFFTLAEFNGSLYAGLFGYELEDASMLYRYPDWEITSPGLTGISESICAMQEFNGMLYANTESSGDIYRSPDGSHWTRVFDGSHGSIGCGMTVFNGQLYAINYRNSANDHGLIMRSPDGLTWETVYDSGSSSMYLREIITYNGKIYAFAIIQESNSARMFSSEDGSSWDIVEVPNRYFRGHVWDGYLWLGSVRDAGSSGEVGVWRYDGNTFTQALTGDTKYFTNIKDLNGDLFASTSNGWKNDPGPSSLWVSPDGMTQWRQICEFDRTAVWSMAVVDSTLYLGTWQYGSSGQVYRVVSGDTPTELPEDSCEPQIGILGVGQTYTVGVDAHTGDEATTEPKNDANDGRGGDNPEFRRHNVARAHNDYWYTSSHQHEGEPNPTGDQWVDFTPNFSELGVGCYSIVTQYRATENRATYAAHYQVMNSEGVTAQRELIQHRGEGEYVDVDMGNHMMCPSSFFRVVDPGGASISFHPTRFTYLGSTCP